MKKNKVLIVLRVFIALAVWFLITNSYSAFIDPMLEGKLPEVIRMIMKAMVMPYTVGLGACYLILKGMEIPGKNTDGDSKMLFDITPGFMLKAFLVQTGISMPVIMILNIVLKILGITPHGISPEETIGKYSLFYIALLLCFAPVMEEILFRKMFLDRLLVIGETGAIIVSAVLFGLPHAFSQGIPQMFGTFLIGLVWAYVRVKTGKLWPGIILHIMFNLYGCYFATFMAMRPGTTVIFLFLGIILLPIVAVIILIKHFGAGRTRTYKAAAGMDN